MSKDSFVIVREQRPAFESLSDEDAGSLIKAVLAYQFDGIEPDLSPVPQMAFAMMRPVFERFAAKYAETCRKRREAGAKGGKAKAANASKCQTGQANVANASNAKQSLHDRDRDPDREEIKEHTHLESHDYQTTDSRSGACVPPAPLNGEDIAERQDAVQAQHRRGDYEFRLVRDAYDGVKPEAPQAGYPEFLRLYNSPQWHAGMHEEILAGLDALAKGDRQFLGEERYRPGLAKFLTQGMWKMKPRAPDGQDGVLTPEQEEAKRMVAEGRRKYEEKMAKLKEQRRKYGYE